MCEGDYSEDSGGMFARACPISSGTLSWVAW